MRSPIRLAPLILMMSCATATMAQVTARSGEPPPDKPKVTRFPSPMILEFPFVPAEPRTWMKDTFWRSTKDKLSGYACDGVSIADFAMAAEKIRGGKVRVTYLVVLANEFGIDKRADVTIDLLRGEETVQTVTVRNASVEEGRNSESIQRKFTITPDALSKLPAPNVRITIAVRDDP